MHDDVKVEETVNITGIVTDEDGNPVGNALVTVMVDGKVYTVMTDSEGRWILSYLTTRTGIIKTSASSKKNDVYVGFENCGFFTVYEKYKN